MTKGVWKKGIDYLVQLNFLKAIITLFLVVHVKDLDWM